MRNAIRTISSIVCACVLAGACVVYEPVAVAPTQASIQQRFDRSWSAVIGAMSDQGVTITAQDRGDGMVRGERSGTVVVASVQTLADGSIQVRFDSPAASDPGLIHRVSESYDRRMGR